MAALTRHQPDNVAALTEARRDLAAANIERFIAETVAAAPPLSAEQRNKLAGLLQPAASVSAPTSGEAA